MRRILFFLFCFAATAAHAADATLTAAWNDNVDNASRRPDRIGGLQFHGDVTMRQMHELGADWALFLGGALSAEAWPRFDGLDSIAAGPRLALQRKFGLGAFAPALRLELGADGVAADESARSGPAGTAALRLVQRFSAATRAELSGELARLDARGAVFARTGETLAAGLDHDLDERWRVSLQFAWRDGDVVSYATPPRPDLRAVARTLIANDTFERPFIVYRLGAHTLDYRIALSPALDERTALSLAFGLRETARPGVRYVNHLVSLGLTRQF
ncbi:MAG TPA: hypothetical protein VMI53_08660 [Opitutaceae bacterium]|nr:hypothetical protein [Opitutaceae bacterium]